jgi:transposase
MQGRKDIQPKMLYQVSLDTLVPADNFYRKLAQTLDLQYLYKATSKYYGSEGQESIDPVVFFKILLVGYLNNINSDRKLMEFCSNCLDVRLFLKYDIDEALPWHSTISRTRQLYGEEVFLSLFQKVLKQCMEKGMIRGKRQAVDSAYIKANASMDSLVEKEVIEDSSAYVNELEENSEYKVTSTRKKLVERHHAWKEQENKGMPGHTDHPKQVDETSMIPLTQTRMKFIMRVPSDLLKQIIYG